MKTFTYISLGCKVNNYECQALEDLLIKQGYKKDNVSPDMCFINTCSVTSTADQKSRQHIRKLKAMYPKAILIVMGCYSQGQHEFIKKNINPEIIIGTSNRNKILDLIKQYEITHQNIDCVDTNPRLFEYEELGNVNYQENARAYLKIEDGCNNFCSYCIIPYRRGKARSRNKAAILNEAKSLVASGYKEIVLTGIDVSFYGKDLENESFSKLVKELLSIDGLYSLRISSTEISDINEDFISLFALPNLAKHIHIPLQSGCDSVLKRMNRKYNTKEFLDKILLIRKYAPDVAITTDVIVGFPGETEEEFNETYNFIKNCGFSMLHVFPYSNREGTVASKMNNQVDPKIKKERCLKLIELSNSLWNQYTSKFQMKEVDVLIEQYDGKFNIGHTTNYLEVRIPGAKINPGTIVHTVYKK